MSQEGSFGSRLTGSVSEDPASSFIQSRVFPTSSVKRPPATPSSKLPAGDVLSPPARIRKQAPAAGAVSPLASSTSSTSRENLFLSRGDTDSDLMPPTETIYEIPQGRPFKTAEKSEFVPLSPAPPAASVGPADASAPIQLSRLEEVELAKKDKQKRWITVFGFSPADRNNVLQNFRSYGEITRTVFPPSDSNWMHIQYSNSFQSGSALTKNGVILSGRIMLGVVPCTEKSVLDSSDEAPQVASAPTLSAADIMRPQTKSFHAAGRTEYNIEKTQEPGPMANQSWWSKVREYVIGV